MDAPSFFFIILLILGFLVVVDLSGASIDTLSEFLEEIGRIKKGRRVYNKKRIKDPLTFLKLRYIKGEITQEEYEEMKSVIGN